MGRKFFPSKNGNMVLTRSKDKKIISLTNFEKFHPNEEFFKIKAWTVKLSRFKSQDNFVSLQHGMNQYYARNKGSFDELIEVSFVGGGKFVQLIYMESVERDLVQQQQYELLMQEKQQEREENATRMASPTVAGGQQSIGNRNAPRKAKKYVFFEVKTGNVVFEYGGIQAPFTISRGPLGEDVQIYELGCLVKEIREESFLPQLVFFFAGDFMDPTIKKFQVTMKYAMNYATIEMRKLFELRSQQEKMDYIQDNIKSIINRSSDDGYLNYFPFDDDWLTS